MASSKLIVGVMHNGKSAYCCAYDPATFRPTAWAFSKEDALLIDSKVAMKIYWACGNTLGVGSAYVTE